MIPHPGVDRAPRLERPVKNGGKIRRDTEGSFFDFDASSHIETRFRRVTV